jgi:myo-inositol-1(or 4)-monophosphatase
MQSYARVCEAAARAGAEVLRRMAPRFSVREKGPSDLVTEADLASQEAIRQVLLTAYPDHGFLGEEGGETSGRDAARWIVDPLDGTTNYVHRAPHYAVSVALERGGAMLVGAVYDPNFDECFTAEAGRGAFLNGRPLRTSGVADPRLALVAISLPARLTRGSVELAAMTELLLASQSLRRTGSAALNLAYLAAGRYDACWATDTKPWDVAAGFLLVREAGGMVTGTDGMAVRLERPRFLAAATGTLHAKLLTVLEGAPAA